MVPNCPLLQRCSESVYNKSRYLLILPENSVPNLRMRMTKRAKRKKPQKWKNKKTLDYIHISYRVLRTQPKYLYTTIRDKSHSACRLQGCCSAGPAMSDLTSNPFAAYSPHHRHRDFQGASMGQICEHVTGKTHRSGYSIPAFGLPMACLRHAFALPGDCCTSNVGWHDPACEENNMAPRLFGIS